MLLLVELIIVVILIVVLAALYIDEHRTRYQRIPVGKMTEYWGGEERRRDIRIDKTLSVRYTVEKKPRLAINSVTKNISTGGMLLETCEKLMVETLLGLEIEIPNYRKAIAADGKVVWVKENPQVDQAGKRVFNTGIKFVNMKDRQKEFLNQYISSLAS